MYILSHNPKNDEFFVGLSLEEFEVLTQEYNVDYGYKSNYEMEKEKAINEHNYHENNGTYHEEIREAYGIKCVPFICIVTDSDCSKISIRPKHFPFANLWNGYSPWQKIEVQNIENLNLKNIKINYVYFSELLESFCNDWIEKFSDENTNQYQLLENEIFPNYCKAFGWIIDNGESFKKLYPYDSYEETLRIFPKVTDVTLLGNLIFSYWRYFNHWAYSSVEILEHRDWFVKALTRLKELAKNEQAIQG